MRIGITTKIHSLTEANGSLIHFVLTGGASPMTAPQAGRLLETIWAENVAGDKAYDTDGILEIIVKSGANPVIPAKSNRKEPRNLGMSSLRSREAAQS
ncbi:MAG: transposase [Candidatus Competibacteraceae bacterium]|nr:transposase [Candidatus Competibacteraceae bacterium]